MQPMAVFLLFLSLLLSGCPWTEDRSPVGATVSEASTQGNPSTGDSPQDPTTTIQPDLSTSGNPEDTGQGGGSGSTDGDSTTEPVEFCALGKVVCQDIADCPEDPDATVTQEMLLDYYRPDFIDNGLVPCFSGNPDSAVDLGFYLRLFREPFNSRQQATKCLLNDINALYGLLSKNPAQLAVYEGLPDVLFQKDEKLQLLWYNFCGADQAHPIKQVTLTSFNDQGMPSQPEVIEHLEIFCSVGNVNALQSAGFEYFQDGQAQADLPGCYINDGSKGQLQVWVKVKQAAGQFRLGITSAEGAQVLGSEVFPVGIVQ